MSSPRAPMSSSVQRCLIVLLIVCIAFTAVAGAVHLLADSPDRLLEVWLGVPAIAALCFALLLTFTIVLRRTRGTLTFLASVLGIVLAVGGGSCIITLLILSQNHLGYDAETALAKSGAISLAISIALAYSGALAMVHTRSNLVRGVAITTGICAWTAAGLLTTILLGQRLLDNDFGLIFMFATAFGLFLLLTVAGTIAVPIAVASAAAKRPESPESIDPRARVDFGCPKCGELQTHRPGFARCAGCGTGLFIEIEEPRCECGYLLYQLTGDTCPECGRAVMPLAAATR